MVKKDDVAHVLTSYRGQKFPFSGQCGAYKNVESVLEACPLFFDQHVFGHIFVESNMCADYCTDSSFNDL